MKLFDGKATTREVAFKRGLILIKETCEKREETDHPSYIIAEAVLDAAEFSGFRPEETERRFAELEEEVA